MSTSYQHEIPAARVNITLNVETQGAQIKRELPFKILVMGDYSAGKSAIPLSKRTRYSLNHNTLSQMMTALSPSLSINCQNTLNQASPTLSHRLSFHSIHDFHPNNLVKNSPHLNRLLAMRNLLKDLKANLQDDSALRERLNHLVKNKKNIPHLQTCLQEKILPIKHKEKKND
jgi:type VI secretion system protein ImpB